MPTVPMLDPSQRVVSSQAPDVQATSTATAGLLDQGTTTQMGQLGDALHQAASVQSQIAVDAQTRINQTRVDDAMNTAQAQAYTLKFDPQTGYANKTGAAAITPDANGMMPADAALQKLNDSAAAVRANLTPVQQREFDVRYRAMAAQFHGEALAHEGQQTKQYSLDTNNSTIKLANDAAVQDYANPDLLDQHIQNAGNAAYKNAQVQGLEGPALVTTVKTAQSTTVRAAWEAAIQNGDIGIASAIQKRYGSSLTADDAVRIDGTMKTAVDMRIGTAVASDAVTPLQMSSTAAGQAFAANIKIESGGKQTNADGTPVVSSKGAVGIAQVLPETAQETAQKHGVVWDENKFRTDATYNASIGQMYWNDQLQANGGDMAKADAAYNAGPGALQAAISKATAAGNPNTWKAYLPPETQVYVQNVAASRQSGAGTSTMPTKADVYAKIDADPRITTPQARHFAYAQADKLFDAQVEAKKQLQTEAQAQALKTVYTTGGDLSQIPPTTLANMNPTDIGALYDAAKKARAGVDFTNPALYQDIVTDMPKYAAMSNDQWYAAARPNLSTSDFEALTKQRADLINNTGTNSPGSINLRAMNETLSQRLQSIGIDPYPPKPNPMLTDFNTRKDAIAQVGAIRQFVTQSLLDAQREAGKKFTEGDIEQHIDNLFTKSVTFGHVTQIGPWTIPRASTTMNMMQMMPSDIPDDVMPKLKADFASHGIANPTSGQLLGAYWTMKTAAQKLSQN